MSEHLVIDVDGHVFEPDELCLLPGLQQLAGRLVFGQPQAALRVGLSR